MIQALARSTAVRVLLTAVILAYLASQLDMREALRAIVAVNPLHLLIVLGLVALDRAVMIWRWVLLLRSAGTPVSTREAARIFLVSSFVGSFLPAGVGADAARAYALSRHTRASEAVASVAIDRYLGVVSLTILGAAGSLLSAQLFSPRERGWIVGAACALCLLSLTLFWIDWIVDAVLPARWRAGALGRRIGAVAAAMSEYRSDPRTLLRVLALSFSVQWLRIVQAYVLGQGLGIDVPFAYYLTFMPVGLLMLLLPVSISGFGLPQGVIVWLLRPMGVPDPQSFALSTLIVLTGLAGNLPGALLYASRRSTPPPPAA